VSDFQLSPHALIDLREIISNRAEYFGEDDSHRLEEDFLAAFERLAATPGLGHRRIDLTSRPYFFYLAPPYFIVYLRNVDPLAVIAVLHTARDVRKLLRKRPFAG
jgi:plasmid stabilization system protein ParE